MPHINTGSSDPARLAVYVNEWALTELPRRPSAETWSFEQCVEKAAAAGYDGCQASPARAAAVRAAGLRFCTSCRINTPAEAAAAIEAAAAVSADCTTVHAGWGMETDAEADALVEAIVAASEKFKVPTFVETHRATITQDLFRTNGLLARHPKLMLNLDASHFYCGGEMTYRGFDKTRHDLATALGRVGFVHGRVSDAECMQCDITDPAKAKHLENFVTIWTEAIGHWRKRAAAGDVLIFAPELGPPSSGYSISVRDRSGETFEVCDRWQQSLLMRDIARRAFEAA